MSARYVKRYILCQVLINTCIQVDELQSSMKKQEKSWQKKLQKMSTSYQDQIDGVSYPLCTVGFTSSQVFSRQSTHKLSVLEQGLQESALSKEKDKAQSSLEKQLSSLKKVTFYCRITFLCVSWIYYTESEGPRRTAALPQARAFSLKLKRSVPGEFRIIHNLIPPNNFTLQTPLRNSPVRVLEYPPTVRVQEDYSESGKPST